MGEGLKEKWSFNLNEQFVNLLIWILWLWFDLTNQQTVN
jgi:hypothetical protein